MGIREQGTAFRAEIPMSEIFSALMEGQVSVKQMYNPGARYTKNRRAVVDWVCELGEALKFQTETIHHAISIYD